MSKKIDEIFNQDPLTVIDSVGQILASGDSRELCDYLDKKSNNILTDVLVNAVKMNKGPTMMFAPLLMLNLLILGSKNKVSPLIQNMAIVTGALMGFSCRDNNEAISNIDSVFDDMLKVLNLSSSDSELLKLVILMGFNNVNEDIYLEALEHDDINIFTSCRDHIESLARVIERVDVASLNDNNRYVLNTIAGSNAVLLLHLLDVPSMRDDVTLHAAKDVFLNNIGECAYREYIEIWRNGGDRDAFVDAHRDDEVYSDVIDTHTVVTKEPGVITSMSM